MTMNIQTRPTISSAKRLVSPPGESLIRLDFVEEDYEPASIFENGDNPYNTLYTAWLAEGNEPLPADSE